MFSEIKVVKFALDLDVRKTSNCLIVNETVSDLPTAERQKELDKAVM